MKRFKWIIAFAVILALFVGAPAQAAMQDMWAAVYSWKGEMNADGSAKLTKITTGVTFSVLSANSSTAETLYYPYSQALTSLTNPVSTTNFASASVCNATVAFRVDPTDMATDRYVDLIVVDTQGGYTAFVEDFDKYTHSIVIDERPNVMHQGTIWFTSTTTAEKDTGIDFLADTFIHDVRVEVVTVSASSTIDVGLLSSETSGDADGLRDGVSLTTAGYPSDTAVITSGTSTDYWPVSTYGALLVTAITGIDHNVTDLGGKAYIGHIVRGANAKSLTYTIPTFVGTGSGAGYIHYFFTRMR